MQVSVTSGEGLERNMSVKLPVEKVEGEISKRLNSVAKTVKISGFRPGKVPMSVVKQRYGGQVRQEVLNELIQSSLQEALVEEKLRPAGYPQIKPESLEVGSDLHYSASFEVYPKVELASLSSLKVTTIKTDIDEQDVSDLLEKMRKQQAHWHRVERPSQNEDQLTLDFTALVEGEAFEGNEAKDFPLVLGSKTMLEGFEEGLIGKSTGEKVTVELQYPEDYHASDLAGKPVQYDITIKGVSEAHLPELNDDLAKVFGIEEGGLDALRQEVKDSMGREVKRAIKEKNKKQVLDILYENNQFDIPKVLVTEEVGKMISQVRERQKEAGMDAEAPIDSEKFEAQAARRVALGLIMAETIDMLKLTASPQKVRAALEEMAASYEQPAQIVEWYYADKTRLQSIESLVLEDEVVDWAMHEMEQVEETLSYEKLMTPESQS